MVIKIENHFATAAFAGPTVLNKYCKFVNITQQIGGN
jgi:hypothetical protein